MRAIFTVFIEFATNTAPVLYFEFWGLEACGISALGPGIELRTEGGVLTTGPPGKSPQFIFIAVEL